MSNPEDTILAVDVSPSAAHLAVVHRDGRTPRYRMIRFPDVDEALDSNVTRAVEIARDNAKTVVDKIASLTPKPRLVVMSKLMLFDAKTDPSGSRRAALWWEIAQGVRKLQTEGSDNYTLAEVAPMTAQKVVTSRAVPGRAGFQDSERGLRALFPALSAKVVDGYRWYVIGEALAGATALGWSTPCTVDRSVLSSMRSRANSFPVEIPKTPEEWDKLNAEHRAVYKQNNNKEKSA